MAQPGPVDQLDNLMSLTDTKLRRLDVQDLLAELLERVREILAVDTAAALLFDPASHSLAATAACGLEEEVYQGVRIPVGHGFAGRIAATRRPVVIDRVDDTTVMNPILWEKGIRTMLGVPLLGGGGRLTGVLHVGRLDTRPFSDEEVSLLEVTAERMAAAIQSRQLAAERSAARLLELSLMPTVLPKVPGASLSGRYVTAERGVGGDWYDAFVLPSGTLWLVTGDVAGHGLDAAVVMSRVRSSLRSYALLGETPQRTLELTDRKVSYFELGAMITVACAVSHPPYETFRLSSAGHPAPLVSQPDAVPYFAEVPADLPLGVDSGSERRGALVRLRPGGVLVMYTDGLVERRGESIDVGLGRLQRAVSPDEPETICRSVMHRLVASSVPEDDIAVLALRRDPPMRRGTSPNWTVSRTFPPDPSTVAIARSFALDALGGRPVDTDVVAMVVSELVANAVQHARTPYTVHLEVDDPLLRIGVSDGSDDLPTRLSPPASQEHGRGLALIEGLSRAWGVTNQSRGKVVWFEMPLGNRA